MKHSNLIGTLATLALIASCFLPWVYIPSINATITGFDAGTVQAYGKPGIVHAVLALFAIIFFLVNKVWAKRWNVPVCTINFAWSLRNYILISHCEAGECPEKRLGIYLIVVLAFVMLLMSLLPKVKLSD